MTATIPGRALVSLTAAAIISRTVSFEILVDGILVEAAPETVASFEPLLPHALDGFVVAVDQLVEGVDGP